MTALTKARLIAYGAPTVFLVGAYFATDANPMFAVGFYFGVLFGAIGATALAVTILDKKNS